MIDLADPQTSWVTWTNLVLGVLVVACWVAVAFEVVVEVLDRTADRFS